MSEFEFNSARYYECVQTGTNTFSKPVLFMCPPGSTFSADMQRCLTGHEDSADSGEKAYGQYLFNDCLNMPRVFGCLDGSSGPL